MAKSRRILIAPMDWGLGHATRCIALIRGLQQQGAEVMLGGEGRSLMLLRQTFPDCKVLELPAYNLQFKENQSPVLAMLLQTPRLLQVFAKEQRVVEKYVMDFCLDGIISDNRYGVFSHKISSVFVSHQLSPISPFRRLAHLWQLRTLRAFQEIWIPDDAKLQLSGDLSTAYGLPTKAQFMGLLSRFDSFKLPLIPEVGFPENIAVVILASGPEPYRTDFVRKAVAELLPSLSPSQSAVIIGGTPEDTTYNKEGNFHFYGHLEAESLGYLLVKAEIVISRGGYSSLMDFAALGLKKMAFLPTPLQTEQLYLAKEMERKKIGLQISSSNWNLQKIKADFVHYQGFGTYQNNILHEKLAMWLDSLG